MNIPRFTAFLAAAFGAVSVACAIGEGASSYVPTYDVEKAWYLGALGVTNLLNAGITGKGVRVGVIDFGMGDIVTGTHTNLHCAAMGGKSKKAMHGPAVEGIIASDLYGIAPECELYVYDDGDGTVDDIIAGFAWCATNGCRVINYSGGVHRFSRGVIDLSDEVAAAKLEELRNAVRAAMGAGCVVVAAGGNAPNETLTCPQDVEGVINVGGITRSRQSAGLNDSWAKDFCAFGKNVPIFLSCSGATGTDSGSSFAAPMATGIIALLLQQEPSLTRDEIYAILQSTAIRLAPGRSKIYGHGLLQATRVPPDYRRQPELDAERIAFVRATSAKLLNDDIVWNEERGFYEVRMAPGESLMLKYQISPEDATDRNLYWYCGNMPTFSPIGLDQVLTIPAKTKPGEFLVYEARNDAREVVCRLRVDVVAAAIAAAALLAIPGKVPATEGLATPESRLLFPATETKPEPNDGATLQMDGDVAVADVAPGHERSGIRFALREPFALNSYWTVSVEVSNRTDHALGLGFYGIHRGDYTWHASQRFRLGPNETKVVTATHRRKCYSLAPGSQGIDGMLGYDAKHFPRSVDTSGAIDYFVVFCDPQEEPARFDVRRIWADGGQPGFTLHADDGFFPFVDEFGQFAHAEWPGKVHSLDGLKAVAKAEDESLTSEPDSPIPGADRFGGWGAGPQLKATGMFRTEKWNGRWWLVDPDGHIFFSLGCNYVRLQCRTPVARRERFFSWLPARDDPLFADCWNDGKLNWLGDSLYKGVETVPQFDFAMANQKRLHGADWKEKFIDRQHRRMRSWGFTSMGNWSDPEIMAASRTPYVDNFNLDGVRKIEGDTHGVWRKFPDVYAPDFASNVVQCALRTRTPKSRTDPWCIGWFVENELHWGRGNKTDDMIEAVVGSPDDQPAKVEYLRRLRAAHGADATFADATAADREAFAVDIAERYFSTVKAAIEEVAPGRLYLGCRFHNSYPAALLAAAKYCDVVSFNCYKDLPETPRFPADAVDKPTIIGEFHFGSLDRGSLHAGLVPCRDMKDRVEHYKAYVRAALRDSRLVGVHWFFWCDMPLTGWMDGEDFMTGVLTVTDTPHPEMVEATRELAREFYPTP